MNIESLPEIKLPSSPVSVSFSTSTSAPHSPAGASSSYCDAEAEAEVDDLANSDSNSNGPEWTDEEDQLLRSIVISDREKNWERVASNLGSPDKDAEACRERWQYLIVSEGARKIRGRWTAEEDDNLASLVHEYGTRNWRIVAAALPGRLPKQCRERWHNQLDPSVRKDGLTDDEWQILREAHSKYGNKWAEIVKLLPGRTANHVKNQWNTMMRRREHETSKKRKWQDVANKASAKKQKSPAVVVAAVASDSSDEDSLDLEVEQILISPKRPKLTMDDTPGSSIISIIHNMSAPSSPSTSPFDMLVAASLMRAQEDSVEEEQQQSQQEQQPSPQPESVPEPIEQQQSQVEQQFVPVPIKAEPVVVFKMPAEPCHYWNVLAPASLSQLLQVTPQTSQIISALSEHQIVLAEHSNQLN